MEKEFESLSEEIIDDLRGGGQLGLRVEKVKEFIRENIKDLENMNLRREDILRNLKQRVGDKLI